jgi:hypothetical protein
MSRRAIFTHPARLTRADTASTRRHRMLRPWWCGPSGPGRDGLAGHHRRVRTYPVVQLAGDELGAGRGDPEQPLLWMPTGGAPRHAALRRRRRPVLLLQQHPLRRQAAVLPGTRQSGQRVRCSMPAHAPRQCKRRRFRGSCREDPVTCSLADTSLYVGSRSNGSRSNGLPGHSLALRLPVMGAAVVMLGA